MDDGTGPNAFQIGVEFTVHHHCYKNSGLFQVSKMFSRCLHVSCVLAANDW